MGNPPYSAKQKSPHDKAQNQKYPKLDTEIENTYAKQGNSNNKSALYDPYIKAFRWASDRLDPVNGGIIGFITNSGWLDSNSMDGFRKCLEKEFSAMYIFNLRGGVRAKSGDLAKREGQNVFNIQTGVAITILVKNPKAKRDKAEIRYHDIGDYLTREQKFDIIKGSKSVLSPSFKTEIITPNEHGDWLSQRNDAFNTFIALGDKENKNNKNTFFAPFYSNGLKTNAASWMYNFNKNRLSENMITYCDTYNKETKRYIEADKSIKFENFVDMNFKKIK